MCCSVAAPVWQKQHIVSSAIKRGELRVQDQCSVRSQLFLERQPHKQFFKDRAYCHRLTGRRKLRSPSYVSAKGSVSVVEERDASSAHRGAGSGQETGFALPNKEGMSLLTSLVFAPHVTLHSNACNPRAKESISSCRTSSFVNVHPADSSQRICAQCLVSINGS
jgi:hypothetical protein